MPSASFTAFSTRRSAGRTSRPTTYRWRPQTCALETAYRCLRPCCARSVAVRCVRGLPDSARSSNRSNAIPLPSASVRPEPARPISPIVMAIRALKSREVARVVLSRPAVEAGESLGFLPGDVREKVDPYMRPLFDALNELLDDGVVATLHGSRYARDRSTGIYARPHAVGSVRDSRRSAERHRRSVEDVPHAGSDPHRRWSSSATKRRSICRSADAAACATPRRRLRRLDAVGVVELDERDVVRHPLVARIIRAYAGGTTGRTARDSLSERRAREDVDSRALVAAAKRLLAVVGESDASLSLSLVGDAECARSTVNIAARIGPPTC